MTIVLNKGEKVSEETMRLANLVVVKQSYGFLVLKNRNSNRDYMKLSELLTQL